MKIMIKVRTPRLPMEASDLSTVLRITLKFCWLLIILKIRINLNDLKTVMPELSPGNTSSSKLEPTIRESKTLNPSLK